MSGYPFLDLQRAVVRSLNGRCVRDGAGVLAKDGERRENCATCQARCGSVLIGFSGGVEVARVWGSDAIELRWPCPACGCEVTQETTALASLTDAEEAKRDPLCYACRSSRATWAVVSQDTGQTLANGEAPNMQAAAQDAGCCAIRCAQDGPVAWWVRVNQKTVMRSELDRQIAGSKPANTRTTKDDA